MKRILKKCLFIMILLFPVLLLTSCAQSDEEVFNFSIVWQSFAWFFTKFSGSYFSNFGNVWEMMYAVSTIWDMPSIITTVIGIILTIFLFIVVVIIYLILIVGYILIFIVFILAYVISAVIAIICLIVFSIIYLLIFN